MGQVKHIVSQVNKSLDHKLVEKDYSFSHPGFVLRLSKKKLVGNLNDWAPQESFLCCYQCK